MVIEDRLIMRFVTMGTMPMMRDLMGISRANTDVANSATHAARAMISQQSAIDQIGKVARAQSAYDALRTSPLIYSNQGDAATVAAAKQAAQIKLAEEVNLARETLSVETELSEKLNELAFERVAAHRVAIDEMIAKEEELAEIQAANLSRFLVILAALAVAGVAYTVIKTGEQMDKNNTGKAAGTLGDMTQSVKNLSDAWLDLRQSMTHLFGPLVIESIKTLTMVVEDLSLVLRALHALSPMSLLTTHAQRAKFGIDIPDVSGAVPNKKDNMAALIREVIGGSEIAKIGIRSTELAGYTGRLQGAIQIKLSSATGRSMERATEDVVNEVLAHLTKHGVFAPARA